MHSLRRDDPSFSDDGSDSDASDNGSEIDASDNDFDSDDSDDFGNDESDNEEPFRCISTALILWAIKFGISHNALTSLLQILIRFGHANELPKHAKTILKTPRKRIPVRHCISGQSFYFGIEKNLIDFDDQFFVDSNQVKIDIRIDGMSASKSSRCEIWPIMGSFVGKYFCHT